MTSIFAGLAQRGPVNPGSIGVRAKGDSAVRTEAGVGALMEWADYLWFTTYPDENGNGTGNGLWRMGDDWVPQLVAETNNTHAGRTIFGAYLFIGQHKIHRNGTVTPIGGWSAEDRISGWSKVPSSIYVYALTMAGKIYRMLAEDSSVTFVADCKPGLGITGTTHFKALWGASDRIYVVTNGNAPDGRLGYYNLTAGTWGVIDSASYIEVAGSYDTAGNFFATGQDSYTGFLWLLDGRHPHPGGTRVHRRFLVPLTHRQQVIAWQQEWMRIRTVDTERFLMDFHGGWFALSTELAGSDDPAIGYPLLQPISRHYRTNTDFTLHKGKLLIGGNQSSGQSANKYQNAGQPQSSIVALDSSDDLFKYGKPCGTGYLYRAESVAGGTESDPMLMHGYDRKSLHLAHTGGASLDVTVKIVQDGASYTYDTLTVPASGYVHHEFPDGFGADWVTVTPTAAATGLSAWVVYS